MGDRLVSTNLSGKLPQGIGQGLIVLEQWQAIHRELSNRYGEKHAGLLAEPATEDGLNYDWYAEFSGQSVSAAELATNALQSLSKVAQERLDDIRRHAEGLANSGSRDEALLGKILLAAINGLDSDIPDNLYSVDGQPVFVNWGVHRTERHIDPGTTEVAREQQILRKKPASTINLWTINWLWLVFAAISIVIFWRLVEGCALAAILGGGFPNFCRPVVTDLPPKLDELLVERVELENEVELLRRRLLAAPQCVHAPKVSPGDPDSDPVSKSDITAGSDLSDLKSLTDIDVNTLLSDSVAGVCEGIEVVATWDGASDIDLHLYCPLLSGGDDILGEERMVGPGNSKSCGAVYDVQNDGSPGRNIERICLTEGAEAGDYLASIYHDSADVSDVSVPVYLSVRGSDSSDSMLVNSKPGNEAETMMPIHIKE